MDFPRITLDPIGRILEIGDRAFLVREPEPQDIPEAVDRTLAFMEAREAASAEGGKQAQERLRAATLALLVFTLRVQEDGTPSRVDAAWIEEHVLPYRRRLDAVLAANDITVRGGGDRSIGAELRLAFMAELYAKSKLEGALWPSSSPVGPVRERECVGEERIDGLALRHIDGIQHLVTRQWDLGKELRVSHNATEEQLRKLAEHYAAGFRPDQPCHLVFNCLDHGRHLVASYHRNPGTGSEGLRIMPVRERCQQAAEPKAETALTSAA